MKIKEIITEAPITNDPERGPWGLVPYNQEIKYKGLRVLMRPSKFLDLSLPLTPAETNPKVHQHITSGGDIASPFLTIELPSAWFDDPPNFSHSGKVMQHDGRNRMTAWLKKYGDDPVEVHLLFRDGIRGRDITDRMIRELKLGLHNEATKKGYGEYITNTFTEVIK